MYERALDKENENVRDSFLSSSKRPIEDSLNVLKTFIRTLFHISFILFNFVQFHAIANFR